MSTVYRAMDLESERRVAVKLLNIDAHLPAITAESYRRELDALSNLRHDNILRILAHGTDENGVPYLVLEWMECDLLERKNRRSPEFHGWDDFASRILLPIVDALAYAHGNDRCHRDIKPANILVASDGSPRLADFGIAKLKRCLQPRITLNEFMSVPFTPPEPDDGSFSFSRDVFAVGVLCLWAMSDVDIAGYEDIPKALERFDAVSDVKDIVARAVSTDPKQRPETAGLLAHEFSRVQNSRERVWNERDRRCCLIQLTNKAMSLVEDHFATETGDSIRQYIDADITSDPAIERVRKDFATPNEQVVQDHFFVYGGSFRYHIAPNDRGRDCFSVIGVVRPPEHIVSRTKDNLLPSPVLFTLTRHQGQMIGAQETLHLLDQKFLEADELKAKHDREHKEQFLFSQWLQVLSARQAYEREQSAAIRFDGIDVQGHRVKLFTDDDLSTVQVEEPRVIKTGERQWIYGDIWQVDSDGVVLNCPSANLRNCPQRGIAYLDTRAAEKALDRQRLAIERVRHGNAVANSLRNLLLNPLTARISPAEIQLAPDTVASLDASQQEAIQAAIQVPDALLVQGPPGTGKTRFIAALVRECIRRNPEATVVLASQTHIAIDNALQRISEYLPESPIVRVARQDANDVSPESAQYLLPVQMQRWRNTVAGKSEQALERWATKLGVSPVDLKIGSTLQQIGILRDRIEETRERVQSTQDELDELLETSGSKSATRLDLEREPIDEELRQLRSKLNADKQEEDRLVIVLKELTPDADGYLGLTSYELVEWSKELLEETDASQMANALLRIQSEWVERFGRDESFTAALFERSKVVAATCIGLASVRGTDDIEYDLCIIDEASKVDATAALVPMVRSRKWVFVGDSRQLPPFEDAVVRDEKLRERFSIDSDEATESMFERLRRLLPPDHQKMLVRQYRMVPGIGNLISRCFYDGELENGEVERKPIDRPLLAFKGKSVVWSSTRNLERRVEQEHGRGVYVNPCEAEEIIDQLHDLARVDFGEGNTVSVLVISGYQAQAKHLAREVGREQSKLNGLRVECCTIDAVQGREADVVFFSVTRSNEQGRSGFLNSSQRVNVALSRAQKLLVIVGDDGFVLSAKELEPLQKVLTHIRGNPDECLFEEVRPRLKLGGRQ
tara:strand:- start:4417 stop:7830 length:3414 start_codon:yes stop_codon:yes gene_type:complete